MITALKPKYLPDIKTIALNLHPNWFDHNALHNIPIDVQLQPTYVYLDEARVLGFITLGSKDGQSFILWLGVTSKLHRQGIGTQLVQYASNLVKDAGAVTLQVETVGECIPPDKWYGQTVAFYQKMGFVKDTCGPEKTFENYRYRMCIFKKDL